MWFLFTGELACGLETFPKRRNQEVKKKKAEESSKNSQVWKLQSVVSVPNSGFLENLTTKGLKLAETLRKRHGVS